jgi:hypothetical protein
MLPLRRVDVPVPRTGASLPRYALIVLWPAFVMAGVLEAIVFVVVDPASLHAASGEPLDWPSIAVHSVAFFVFWAVIAASAAVTCWLERAGDDG